MKTKTATKERMREYSHRWYIKNRKKVIAANLRWVAANPEKYLAGIRRWQAAHPEKLREYMRRYRRKLKAKRTRRTRRAKVIPNKTWTELRVPEDAITALCGKCGMNLHHPEHRCRVRRRKGTR